MATRQPTTTTTTKTTKTKTTKTKTKTTTKTKTKGQLDLEVLLHLREPKTTKQLQCPPSLHEEWSVQGQEALQAEGQPHT